ncbi:MAG: LCP family protein [Nocardioidaceae bacterium]
MADRPDNARGKDFDWLYGQGQVDDDATRRIPVRPRPEDAAGEGDHTRVMPNQPVQRAAAQRPVERPRPAERGRQAPPARSRARRPRRRRPGRMIALLLLLILVFLLAVPIWAWSQITKVAAEPSGERPANTPGATYLLVGSDSREGLSAEQKRDLSTGSVEGRRTDTIMLMHVPRFGGKTLLLSLPRDSIVDIPGNGTNKINAAYAIGGPKLLVQTVEAKTGVRIDNYVEIGLGGFANIVEGVGGVTICPKKAMNDKDAGLDIEKGCQKADGATALGYARSRKVDGLGDVARAERQREVVGKIADKAASPWTVVNPVRYVSVASAGADALAIGKNVGPLDLARFAWAMRKVTGDEGLNCTVPLRDLAVNWDEDKAAALFEKVRQDDTNGIKCDRTGGIS